MLQRRRPLDQPGVDVLEPGLLIDGDEFLRRRDTSWRHRSAARSRARPAHRRAPRAAGRGCPARPSRPAKRPPCFSANQIARAARSLSSTQCSVALEKAASNASPNFSCGRIHQPRVEPLGLGRADHAQAVVDADDVRAHFLDLERQRPVAAADIEDMLARLRVEQLQRRLPQRRHEAADAGIIRRVPLAGRGGRVDRVRASSPIRDRRLRPSALRARTDRRASA